MLIRVKKRILVRSAASAARGEEVSLKFLHFHIFLLAVMQLLFLWQQDAYAVKEGNDRILFLFIRLEKGVFVLESAKIRPGRVKQKKMNGSRENCLKYETVSIDGREIDNGVMFDPALSTIRLEYADTDDHEQIKKIVVSNETVRFVLRLPYRKNIAQVNFLRMSSKSNAKTIALDAVNEYKVGEIKLNLDEIIE